MDRKQTNALLDSLTKKLKSMTDLEIFDRLESTKALDYFINYDTTCIAGSFDIGTSFDYSGVLSCTYSEESSLYNVPKNTNTMNIEDEKKWGQIAA